MLVEDFATEVVLFAEDSGGISSPLRGNCESPDSTEQVNMVWFIQLLIVCPVPGLRLDTEVLRGTVQLTPLVSTLVVHVLPISLLDSALTHHETTGSIATCSTLFLEPTFVVADVFFFVVSAHWFSTYAQPDNFVKIKIFF